MVTTCPPAAARLEPQVLLPWGCERFASRQARARVGREAIAPNSGPGSCLDGNGPLRDQRTRRLRPHIHLLAIGGQSQGADARIGRDHYWRAKGRRVWDPRRRADLGRQASSTRSPYPPSPRRGSASWLCAVRDARCWCDDAGRYREVRESNPRALPTRRHEPVSRHATFGQLPP